MPRRHAHIGRCVPPEDGTVTLSDAYIARLKAALRVAQRRVHELEAHEAPFEYCRVEACAKARVVTA